MREAVLEGGQACHRYWEGQDTLAPAGADSTGYDSLITSDWVQFSWLAGNEGTYPNFSASDSAIIFNVRFCDVWVRQDTTTFSHTDGSYGDVADGDSVGYAGIWFECILDSTDEDSTFTAILADSTNRISYDGGWFSDQYGHWIYEDYVEAFTVNVTNKTWRIHHARIPICSKFRIIIDSRNDMLQTPVTIYRIVAKH